MSQGEGFRFHMRGRQNGAIFEENSLPDVEPPHTRLREQDSRVCLGVAAIRSQDSGFDSRFACDSIGFRDNLATAWGFGIRFQPSGLRDQRSRGYRV